MNTVIEVLRAARLMIQDESSWCKGWLAKDARDNLVACADASAVKFCIAGACVRVCGEDLSLEDKVLRHLSMEAMDFGFNGPAHLNDSRTHAEVMAFLDQVIQKLET